MPRLYHWCGLFLFILFNCNNNNNYYYYYYYYYFLEFHHQITRHVGRKITLNKTLCERIYLGEVVLRVCEVCCVYEGYVGSAVV